MKSLRLALLILAFAGISPSYAQLIQGGSTSGGSGEASSIIGSTTLPEEPCTLHQVYSLWDELGSGESQLYYCSNGIWRLVSEETDDIDTVFSRGNEITGATPATPLIVGDGVTPLCIYTDPTSGPSTKPCTPSDTRTSISDGYTHGWFDEEGDADMFIIDPDATDNDKYTWQSGYRPIKTISFPADSLYPLGSASVLTNAALVSGGLIVPYLTVTDSDSDGFYRYHVMDPKWDGGTVTATVTVVNVNGTPANNFEVDVSGTCYPAGTVVATTISATGEQAANIDFDASGACGGSACSQNDPASATTSAITLNGTPAGGNLCAFQAQVDATATTETVAGIKIVQMDIHYKIAKGF